MTTTVIATVTRGLASQTGSPTSAVNASSANSPVAATTDLDQKTMKVGLGVGIPLGILLLAAVGYLIWELGKKRKAGGGSGEGLMTVYEADNGQHETPARLANGVEPNMQQHAQSQSPDPKYEQYPQQQSFPSPEVHVASPVVAYQVPAELGRGEWGGGYHVARGG